jgi:hydroxymethylbilane synthase
LKELIIASRKSKLAMWQSEHIKARLEALYPEMKVTINQYSTKGDRILDVPLAKIGGKGLFTKELEEAMLRGDAHIAVHSLKDVPTRFEEGFVLCAVTKREDERDAMLSEKYESIDALPQGAIVGTTSLRRRMQLLKYRSDLVIKDLRGNVQTRIKKLKDGEYDAIILATAGINRLGIQNETNYFTPISKEIMIPSMGQAALGIECCENPEIIALLKPFNDERAVIETTIERTFIDALDGGCQVPIGVNAELNGDDVSINTVIGMPDGEQMIGQSITISKSEYEAIGTTLANEMIEQGAKEILAQAIEASPLLK